MASPSSATRVLGSPVTVSRALRSPTTDEAMWRRLHEAGFDEESIKRRDKAALIAYIAKLEAEMYNIQTEMGLLIIEKKELVSNYEQFKATTKEAELVSKHEHAGRLSALAEAKIREANLKKALGVEKECLANIEKALHEMRAEAAEAKVAAEMKLMEARSMMETADKKFTEAEEKLRAAESLEAEGSRYHRTAQRKLHEVEAREDDLKRRLTSFKTDCDAKDKEMLLERQSLLERQKALQKSQEILVEGQSLLNQREDYLFNRSQELDRLEKDLETSKSNVEQERKSLIKEKSELELKAASLAAREQDLAEKENELHQKAEELVLQQDKIASKESERIQQVISNHEAALKRRKIQFEADLEAKQKLKEDEIETKRRASELREVELCQREDLILEKEHDLTIQLGAVSEKERDLIKKLKAIEEKENNLHAAESEFALQRALFEKEKGEIIRMRNDLQKSVNLLDDKKQQLVQAEEKVAATKTETDELLALEVKLKEEIDFIRTQKHELELEADELKVQKTKFETEWEVIDEKREELRKEEERIAEERVFISKFFNDERESLKLEKDAMRDQFTHDTGSLSRDREAFMREMEKQQSEWFGKIQKERTDLLRDIEMQRKELENCIEQRREEIESYLREQENKFEEQKNREYQYITSLRETVEKETEQINLEMQKLESERREIILDHERRDKEWAELNNSIEELKAQREKLEKQRELLHADREVILAEIEQLKKLEDLKAVPYRISAREIVESGLYSKHVGNATKVSQQSRLESICKLDNDEGAATLMKVSNVASPPRSSPFAWLKRCADTLLEQTHSKKKKHQTGGTELEVTAAPCVLSSEPNIVGDEQAVTLVKQAAVEAKETTVYIDKIITTQEVTTVVAGRITEDSESQQISMSQGSNGKPDDCIELRSDETENVKPRVERKRRPRQKK